MEVVLFLILFVIFILMIVTLSSLSDIKSKVEKLDAKVSGQFIALREELARLRQGDELPKKAAPVALPITPPATIVQTIILPPVVAPLVVAEPPKKQEQVLTPAPKLTEAQQATAQPKPPVLKQPPVESAVGRIMSKIWNWIVVGEEFRNPGVPAEFAIATAWLVRIGIIIVVMAVGFGLQLSIKRGLLGPSGRVACALFFGSAFVALGLRNMTKKLHLLGQGFIGGGLAMFYFSFFAASMMFKLIPLEVAFGCMIGVTAAAVVIAVRFNALSIAAFGAVGGYLTPVMIRTSEGNLPGLSAYLLLLAAGILCVSIWRQWPLLTWLSFFLNTALFSTALVKYGTGGVLETTYVSIFFAIYSTAMFIYPVFRKIKVTPAEILPLFLNVGSALAWGWWIMDKGDHPRTFLAFMALGMAAFYVIHIWAFLYLRNFDRGLLSAFIALTVILIGIALPLLFTGNILSTVFALQALAFLWLGGKLESKMFIRGALCLYLVVLARLLIGFFNPDSFAVGPETSYFHGLKDRVAEFIVPILSLFLAGRCFKRLPAAAQHRIGDEGLREGQSLHKELMVAGVVFYASLIAYVSFELFSASKIYAPEFVHANITLVWCAFVFHLLMMRKHLSSSALTTLTFLAGVAIVGQWFFFGWMGGDSLHLHKLCHHDPFSTMTALARVVSTAVCMMVLLKMRDVFKGDDQNEKLIKSLSLNVVLAMGFLYLTFEAATFSDAYITGFRQWAVSIVWGCYGLSLLVSGLHFAKKQLRMVGLFLFALTIFKIFFVDLAKSDVLFRLIAFALVGVVLLLAAYAYLRKQDTFKRSVTGDKEGSSNE
jgi:uncharacterized membrane protein